MYEKHGIAPKEYKCSSCGAHNVKLWRQYNTFVEHIDLLCRPCAFEDQDETEAEAEAEYSGDQIGWLVPAVPCDEMLSSYWGYSAVTARGIVWWYSLKGIGRCGSTCAKQERKEVLLRMKRDHDRFPHLFDKEDIAFVEGLLR